MRWWKQLLSLAGLATRSTQAAPPDAPTPIAPPPQLDGLRWALPVGSNSLLVATDTLACFDEDSARLRWRWPHATHAGCSLPGDRVALASDQGIVLLKLASGQECGRLPWPDPDPVTCLAAGPRGERLAAGSKSACRLYSLSDGAVLDHERRQAQDRSVVVVGHRHWAWIEHARAVGVGHAGGGRSTIPVARAAAGLVFHPERSLLAIASWGMQTLGAMLSPSGGVEYGSEVGNTAGLHIWDLDGLSRSAETVSADMDAPPMLRPPSIAAPPPGLLATACPNGLLGATLSPSGSDVVCWTAGQLFTHPWPAAGAAPQLQSRLGGAAGRLMDIPYFPQPIRGVSRYPDSPSLLLHLEPASVVRCSPAGAVWWLELSAAASGVWIRRD